MIWKRTSHGHAAGPLRVWASPDGRRWFWGVRFGRTTESPEPDKSWKTVAGAKTAAERWAKRIARAGRGSE